MTLRKLVEVLSTHVDEMGEVPVTINCDDDIPNAHIHDVDFQRDGNGISYVVIVTEYEE